MEGRRAAPPSDPAGAAMRGLLAAMVRDPEAYRGYLETISMLALPQEIVTRPGMAERIKEAAADGGPAGPPGPSRAEVLAMLA